MATQLTTYDFSAPSKLTSSERQQYPWELWLNGAIWRIEYDVDFFAHPLMMERIIRTRATARHAKVQIKHEPGGNDDVFGVIVMRRSDIAAPKPPRAPRKKAPVKAAPTKAATKAAAKPGAIKAMNGKTVAKKAPAKKAPAKRLAKV